MTRLAEDITFLQRAADTAGLVLFPGGENKTFPERNVSVAEAALVALKAECAELRSRVREYPLIGVEAEWLMESAQRVLWHRAEGNAALAERWQLPVFALRRLISAVASRPRRLVGR